MSQEFWDGVAERDRVAAEAKRDALRAERQADMAARLSPDALARCCCTLKFLPETERCGDECAVLAALWPEPRPTRSRSSGRKKAR